METMFRSRLLILGFITTAAGCATTEQHGSRYTDAEVEMAMRRTEADTLARMAASSNNEIADAASYVARQRARQ